MFASIYLHYAFDLWVDVRTQDTVCSSHRNAYLDSTQHIQEFGWRNLFDRSSAKSREDVTLETPDGANSPWLSD
jgi:hypothetical protein